MRRKEKEVQTKCIKSEKVVEYLTKIANTIVDGRDKVWVTKSDSNISFIVGNERLTLRVGSIGKGGIS